MNQELVDRISRAMGIVAFVCLAAVCLVTILPLVRSIAWAIVLVLTSWPIYRRLMHLMPKRPGLAALLMTISLSLVSVLAVTPILVALTGELERSSKTVQKWVQSGDLHAPEWMTNLPLVGPRVEDWMQALPEQTARMKGYIKDNSEPFVRAATATARRAGKGLFTFVISLVFCYFFYRHGITLGRQIGAASSKIGGARFRKLIGSIRDTVRAAVYGAVFTAIAQGCLAGLGYVVAGAPVPILLGFFTMLMALLPFGAPLVYIPVSVLVVANGAPPLHGVLLVVWGISVVSTVDNILRPMFISQSTNMPLGLSLVGVIGGLIQFGLLGIILGPVAFAVAHVLWTDWLADIESVAA